MSTRTNSKGHALLLLLVGMTAALALGSLVGRRVDGELGAARVDEAREQALWLARSAAANLKAGDREVAVRGGRAKVHVAASVAWGRGVEATVAMPDGSTAKASVRHGADGRPVDWQERFERAEAR